jgi:Domain of Unknown Function (DUF1080)
LVTRAWFEDLQLHLEWRRTEGASADPGDQILLQYSDGLTIDLGRSTAANNGDLPVAASLALPKDSRWHTLDLWLKLSREDQPDNGAPTTGPGPERNTPARGSVTLVAWIDGQPAGEVQQRLTKSLAHGPLTLRTTAQETLLLRHTWLAPLEFNAEHFEGPWTELEPNAAGESQPAFAVRGGTAEFEWRQEAGKWLLVGRSVAHSPNTFLTSVQTLSDFELEFEVRQDPRLNSGVQIRSQVLGGFDAREGPLMGYQVELDASPRAYSGGLYEERGRGWLQPLSDDPAARAAYRPGEWNSVRVLARGPSIQTWVNGVPAGDLFDARARTGHLAFQVHGVGAEEQGLEVAWRRIRWRSR